MRLVSLECKRSCILGSMIRYTPRTVSYAKELTSVPICISQGNGFSTPLSRLLHKYCARKSYSWSVGFSVPCSVVRSCPTSDDDNKDYVCTRPTSTRINRPPHLDHLAHAPWRAQRLINSTNYTFSIVCRSSYCKRYEFAVLKV